MTLLQNNQSDNGFNVDSNYEMNIAIMVRHFGFRQVLKEVFDRMDKDKSGKLNGAEVMEILMNEDMYSQDDINALFTKCKDSDGDESVNCAEFIEAAF